MKQLTCEMCGGTDLVKQDGVFVCQSCGCKYSIEEAKKMMVEGTVEVTGTVRVDNSGQIQHYLELSRNAYESANGQSAFDYANKALELDPQNPQAWIAKMKSIEHIATLGELRLKEVIEAGKCAVMYAPEAEKDAITLEVYTYELTRCLTLLKVAMIKMNDTDDIKATYRLFCATSLLTAGVNASKADSEIVSLYDKVADKAIEEVTLVPDEVIARFSSLAKLVGECAKQYQYETNALINRYKIYGSRLTDSAQKIRTGRVENLNEKVQRAEAEQAKRVKLYWAEHEEERQSLESELQNLYIEKDALAEKMNTLIMKLDATPMMAKKRENDRMVAELKKSQGRLGMMFSKSLKGQIDELTEKSKGLVDAVMEEQAPINAEIEQTQTQIDDIIKRMDEIQAEFDKDR